MTRVKLSENLNCAPTLTSPPMPKTFIPVVKPVNGKGKLKANSLSDHMLHQQEWVLAQLGPSVNLQMVLYGSLLNRLKLIFKNFTPTSSTVLWMLYIYIYWSTYSVSISVSACITVISCSSIGTEPSIGHSHWVYVINKLSTELSMHACTVDYVIFKRVDSISVPLSIMQSCNQLVCLLCTILNSWTYFLSAIDPEIIPVILYPWISIYYTCVIIVVIIILARSFRIFSPYLKIESLYMVQLTFSFGGLNNTICSM